MYYKTKDQVNLHYVDTGNPSVGNSIDGNAADSAPVVLVPGWAYSVEVFQPLIDKLSTDHRVIALDPRGHGKSDDTEEGIDFGQQAKDLVALMDALDIQKMYLVGWSYGAYAVWGAIREMGLSRIAGIMIIDQPPRCTGDEDSKKDGIWTEYMPENVERAKVGLSTEAGYRMGVENFARNAAFTGGITEEEVARISAMSDMPYELAVKEFFAGTVCDDTEIAVEADRCETCKSVMVIRESWAETAVKYMKTICPNTDLHVLGGHMMFYEHEEAFMEIMKGFLES